VVRPDTVNGLDVVVSSVWDIVRVVTVSFAHDEPNNTMAMYELLLKPGKVVIRLGKRGVNVIESIIFKA
jgi:hypothetical protein